MRSHDQPRTAHDDVPALENLPARPAVPDPQPPGRRTILSVRLGRIIPGVPVTVYEALHPLRCARCQQEIPPGARFIRRTQPTAPLSALPGCTQCYPVDADTLEAEARGSSHKAGAG